MVIDDPRLADLINGPTLRSLLADAERLSGLHASVLDAEGERLPDHDGAASLPRFCQLVQETAEGAARCRRCALRAAFQAAGQQHPHLYHCHAGLMNVAVPLKVGDTFLGTLLVGAVVGAPLDAAGLQEMQTQMAEISVSGAEVAGAAQALPVVAEDQLWAGAHLLASAVAAAAEASLHDRAWRAVRLRLDALIRELCAPRPDAPAVVLPAAERGVVDAWAAGDARALRATLRQVAVAMAPDWAQHPVVARLRLLDLLIALARHGECTGAFREVRDTLIPFATALLGVRTWPEVESQLGDLGRELGRFLHLPAPPCDGRIDRVVRYVQLHFQSALSLHEVARSVGLGPQYFCSLFKARTGCSFMQYVRRLRLAHARELLRTTALPVTEVALESGFHDVTYFGQVFKAAEGLTPSEYRRQGAWSHHLPFTPAPVEALAAMRPGPLRDSRDGP